MYGFHLRIIRKINFPISVDFQMTAEQFAEQSSPGAKEIGNMFAFYVSGKLTRDIAATRALNPKVSNFRDWVARNRDALVAALE